MSKLKFVDLFAGIGGFHRALSELGHECVFASELDDNLRRHYVENFPNMQGKVFGDIRNVKDKVPNHDILCAGFPCQPFSKSGFQLGMLDETRGTLFHEILEILEANKPKYVILENVGNFGRHDDGRTWAIVRRRLELLGYKVAGTEHLTPPSQTDWRDAGTKRRPGSVQKEPKGTSGNGLLSPHHFGQPHHRERFFIIATLGVLPHPPFPERRCDTTSLTSITQHRSELSQKDIKETRLSTQQTSCIELWGELARNLPSSFEFPAAPLWGDEFAMKYPYTPLAPYAAPLSELKVSLDRKGKHDTRAQLMELLPRYAQEEVETFRQWKINYIQKNREWWTHAQCYASPGWLDRLLELPPSQRKLEWNVKGEERDIWRYVLQFRPSGLRVKRYTSSPALVAMTETQIPILGLERRFLTRVEGLRLQGFPDSHILPERRVSAFKALGNAVNVVVVKTIAKHLLGSEKSVIESSAESPNPIKGNYAPNIAYQ